MARTMQCAGSHNYMKCFTHTRNRLTIYQRIIFLLLVCTTSFGNAFPQSARDSLLNRLKESRNDTERVDRMNGLAWYYVFSYIDTSIQIAKQSLELLRSISYPSGEGESYALLVLGLSQTGNFAESADFGLKGIDAMEKARD